MIDALIFSELSYVHFDDLVASSLDTKGIPLSSLCHKFFSLHYDKIKIGAIIPTEKIIELFKLVAHSRRFSSVTVRGYVNEVDVRAEKQFCAMCFDIGKNITVVAYRGTDDTIIGWKEDLNMAFFTPIPSQRRSAEYLKKVLCESQRELYYVCGHSKGGNLATYATLKATKQMQSKIVASYNFDGPGFTKSFASAYSKNSVAPKLIKISPEGTLVGSIFDSVEHQSFVKSKAKGLYQHDAFNWEIMGKDFVYVNKQTKSSADFHRTLDGLVDGMTKTEKIEFVDALYKFLTVNDATTLTDIASDKIKFIFGILKSDEKTKKTVFSLMNRVIKEKYFKKDLSNSKQNRE